MPFQSLMLKSFPSFTRNGAHLGKKKDVWKNKDYPLFKFECFEHAKIFWFVSSFEHINFAINGKYSKNFYDNANYYASFVIFQTLKNAILTPLIVFLPYCYCFGCDVDLVVLHNTQIF